WFQTLSHCELITDESIHCLYDSVSKGGVRSMMQVLKIKFVCDTDFLMYILPVVCVFSKNYQKNLVVHVKVDLFQLF
ncbi:hypothetical protein, partial [Thiolapillus sp.]|uniref:hypothetical protein n=1 Tax=Thiolapillus sp. TaxID=2017437 RepID=UPI003AF92A0A